VYKKQSLESGAFIIATSSIIFMLASYATNIFLGRHLGPSLYGIYGVITALMTALNITQTTGLPQAVSKFISEETHDTNGILKSGIRIQLISNLIIALILIILAPAFANLFHYEEMEQYLRITALIFPTYGLFALFLGYYNGLHNFKRQALMNSVYSVSKLFLVIILAIAFSLYGVIVGFILAPLVALSVGFAWPKSSKSYSYASLILFSLPLIGFAALVTLQLSIDLFSLKAIEADAKIAGFYTAAQSIAIIPYFMMSSIGQVLFPSISQFTGSGNIKEASRIISKSLRYLLLILLPVASIMITTANDLVEVLFGKKYLPAVAPLQILLVSYVFLTIFTTLANVLNSSRHAKSSMFAAGIGLAITLISCLILIPHKGMEGAAIASLIGALISACIAIIKTYRTFRFQFSFMSMLKIAVGSTVILAAGSLIQPPLLTLPIFYIFLGSLYIAVIHVFGKVTMEDRSHIKNLLPSWLPLTRWL
jgi:stage V sporulation protein B